MSVSAEVAALFQALIMLEASVGDLYARYAERFPATAALWRELALEETQHADWLRALRFEAEEGDVIVPADRMQRLPLAESMQALVRRYQAEAGAVTEAEALRIACSLEASVLEQRFYDVVADGPERSLQSVFAHLDAATRSHRARLQAALAPTASG